MKSDAVYSNVPIRTPDLLLPKDGTDMHAWATVACDQLDIRPLRFSRNSRYSFRHSHFCTVHHCFRYDFTPHTTLSYHTLDVSQASVYNLAPLNFRRRVTRPVSYYALFE